MFGASASLQSEVQDIENMHVAYLEIFSGHFNSIFKDTVEHSKDVHGDMEQFKEHILGFDKVEKKMSALASAITVLDSNLPDDTDDYDQLSSRVDEALKSQLERQATFDRVDLLLACIDNRLETEAEEVEEEEESLVILESTSRESFKDPLTKRTMTDPVKSATCGHSYQRDTILVYLERAQRCPYSGCVKPLARSDLVDDLKMKAKLRNMRKSRSNGDDNYWDEE